MKPKAIVDPHPRFAGSALRQGGTEAAAVAAANVRLGGEPDACRDGRQARVGRCQSSSARRISRGSGSNVPKNLRSSSMSRGISSPCRL